jgi:hypothetical protein
MIPLGFFTVLFVYLTSKFVSFMASKIDKRQMFGWSFRLALQLVFWEQFWLFMSAIIRIMICPQTNP